MSFPDPPTEVEQTAWNALTFDDRVLRIVLVKIRGREICHLGLTVANPAGVLPRSLTYRGTLGEVLTQALVELDEIGSAS